MTSAKSIAALLVFCFFAYLAVEWYRTVVVRITLNVETPDGRLSDSAILAVRYSLITEPIIPGTSWAETLLSMVGTAPIVDTGRHGWLIAALRTHQAFETGRSTRRGRETTAGWHMYGTVTRTLAERTRLTASGNDGGNQLQTVRPEFYPQFVWLPAGATSRAAATPVTPSELKNIAGPGVSIVSLTIEPVLRWPINEVAIAPTWLNDLREKSFQITGVPHGRFGFYLSAVETRYPPKRN